MADKCFCHLNGYKVKDADARKSIEDLTTALSETNQNMSDFTNEVNNSVNALSENITKTSLNLVDTNVRIDDNDFNTSAMYIMHNVDLDVFVTENFETENDIDETKDDGNYVITNNYDRQLHRIIIPSGNIKMIRSKAINVEFITKKFFIHIEKDGDGTIEAYYSSDNGVTFNSVEQDTLIDCTQGKQLVVQLKLTGEVILKNLCWGVKF